MLHVRLDELDGIAILEPEGALSEEDFHRATEIVDPYIEKVGGLTGLIIHVEQFPGWDSFAGLVSHLKFVKDHHKRINKIAFATDSPVGEIAEHVAGHFVSAEVRHFGFADLDEARDWILAAE